MNKIVLVGRLTKDPELRSTTAGFSTASFTVAVNRNFKNKDGNYDADFLPCVAFRNTATFVSRYFKKGNLICVEGRVQTRSYDAQDGSKRYVTEIVVENAEFVGGKMKVLLLALIQILHIWMLQVKHLLMQCQSMIFQSQIHMKIMIRMYH